LHGLNIIAFNDPNDIAALLVEKSTAGSDCNMQFIVCPMPLGLNIVADTFPRNAVAPPRSIVAVKMGKWPDFIFSIKINPVLIGFSNDFGFPAFRGTRFAKERAL
jgi:hypothetical protein